MRAREREGRKGRVERALSVFVKLVVCVRRASVSLYSVPWCVPFISRRSFSGGGSGGTESGD